MAKPPGLKTFPKLLSQKEVDLIVANDEYTKNPGDVLFRYYGDFGHNTPEPTTPPKADAPIRRGAPGKETPPPSPWMLAWGKTLQDRGFFDEMPNQYRVTDWFGSLFGPVQMAHRQPPTRRENPRHQPLQQPRHWLSQRCQ